MSPRLRQRRLPGRRRALCALAAFLGWLAPATGPAEIRLREVAVPWGLDFRHHHGGSGERYMVESTVGGVLLLDHDGDGDLDVLFVDGAALPGYEGEPPKTRLYRNDGPAPAPGPAQGGPPRFVDVTAAAGLDFAGYGCGGAAADLDGDGDTDVYLTAFGDNALYLNQGDGTFQAVPGAAGAADSRWSAAAAFADPDRDGDLDLYVSNYVNFTLATHKFCGEEEKGLQAYCHPGAYDGVPDVYFENRGDGTFTDATAAAGLVHEGEAGLGMVFGDLDDDGWPDIYVANDADPNFLWRNKGDGTFEDWSLLSGTAYSEGGSPEAGMGVDLADIDADGHLDIVVTNFELETNALYRNAGGGLFTDIRFPTGIAEPSLLDLAFGVAFADLDHDADQDLVVANGHVLDNAVAFNPNSRYAQVNSVLENSGGRFRLVDAGFELERVSRGLAAGDLDGDGDVDVVVSNSNDVAEVYENLTGAGAGDWLLVDLAGAGGNRQGVGARVELETGGVRQVREVRTGGSYISQGAVTVHFGLGEAERAERLRIRWPDGRVQEVRGVPAGRRLLVGRLVGR